MNHDKKNDFSVSLLAEKIKEIEVSADKVIHKIANLAPPDIKNTIKFFKNRVRAFYALMKDENVEGKSAAKIAQSIANSAVILANSVGKYENFAKKTNANRHALTKLANGLAAFCSHFMDGSGKRLNVVSNHAAAFVREHINVAPINIMAADEAVPRANLEEEYFGVSGLVGKVKELDSIVQKSQDDVRKLLVNIREDARRAAHAEKDRAVESLKKCMEDANAIFGKIDELHKQSRVLAGDIATSALAKDYAKHAVEEEEAADLFRWIGLGIMGVVVVYLGYSLWELRNGQFKWDQAIFRLIVSLLVSVPIAYVSRESAKHRAQAIDLRKTSLDFSALGPYLENVAEPKRSELRAEIAQRVFFSESKFDGSSSFGLDPQAIIMKGMETIADMAKQKKN